MAKKSDPSAGPLDADNTEGLLAGLFAEENELDRRTLWRIGSWGVVTIGAVVIAVYANQASLRLRGEQVAADDLARQAQQIRQLAREGQVETRKLASAVDTLNGDRDRLYSRVTVLEQGLDSVTGAIARQAATAAKPVVSSSAPDGQASQQAPPAQPVPVVSPVATAPAANAPAVSPVEKRAEAAKPDPQVKVASAVPAPAAPPAGLAVPKSMMGPPDPAAPKLIEAPSQAAAPAAAPPAPVTSPKPEALAALPANDEKDDKDEAAEEKTAVQRTEFAVDLGSANSVGGLRALWRTVVASNAALKALTPIILVRENKNGLGAQLRLAAGPLQDAATAAKICAALAHTRRGCETTVYDGQRLAMATTEAEPFPGAKPEGAATKPAPARHAWTRHSKKEEPPPKEESKSPISSWFNKKP